MQTTAVPGKVTDSERARDDIAVVEAFFAAMEAQDLERGLALLTDDIVYQNVPFPADRGKTAVRRSFQAFGYFVSGFAVQMRHIAARDGVVLTDRVDILTGPLIYLDIHVCGTFEMRDGRIAVWRDYFDLAATTAKLLVSPIRSLVHRARSRS
jgi:limonene-1,2-epoxide hydrolase